MFQLRHYQQQAVNNTIKTLDKYPKSNPIIIAPCGSGKSLIIATIAAKYANDGLQVLVITPRKKLLQQNAQYLPSAGICSASFSDDLGFEHKVVFGTFQTLINRTDRLKKPDIIIIDEVHLLPEDEAARYSQLLEVYSDANIIGLTATPFKKRASIFDSRRSWRKAYEIDIVSLIRDGYLAPIKAVGTSDKQIINPNDNLDVDITSITDNAIDNAIAINNKHERHRTLVFSRSIEHACYIQTSLIQRGVQVRVIHSKQNQQEQDATLRWFSGAAGVKTLINVNICTTGVDLPNIDSIILLRHITSIALYLQILGRGMRIYPGKLECLVLDYGMNVRRFGLITDIDISKKQLTADGYKEKRFKSCPVCDALNDVIAKECNYCHHTFTFKTNLQDVADSGDILPLNIGYGIAKKIDVQAKGNCFFYAVTLESGVIVLATRSSPDAIKPGMKCIYESRGQGCILLNVA